jgi:hypothetical protein
MGVFRAYPYASFIHYSPCERVWYEKLQKKYPDVSSSQDKSRRDRRLEPTKGGARSARVRTTRVIRSTVYAATLFRLALRGDRPASEWPTMDYSIKSLAKCCGFNWRDTDPSGAASIEWFDKWVRSQDPALKQRLLGEGASSAGRLDVSTLRPSAMPWTGWLVRSGAGMRSARQRGRLCGDARGVGPHENL